jgi:hypothetical protein
MTLDEAILLARQGIKMTHRYFSDDEYMVMRGNIIKFEDGVEIFMSEWIKGKDYLLTGWVEYNKESI